MVTTTVDDRGKAKSIILDLLGRRKALIDQKGQRATFSYDLFGNLVQTSLAGQLRTYTHNGLGWMTSRREPEEGQTLYGGFTTWGQPCYTTRKGRTGSSLSQLQTVLDESGRSIRIQDSATYSWARSMTYHPTYVDCLKSVVEDQPYGRVTETYGYDGLARLTRKTISDETGQVFSTSRQLDAMGNQTALTYPQVGDALSRSIQFGYDAYFRPQTAVKGNTRGNMSYDLVSGKAVSQRLTYGNGATSTLKTDSGELTQVVHTLGGVTKESSALTWTAGGLLLNRGASQFDYDELGRLTYSKVRGVHGETHAQSFQYDSWGNRTSVNSTVSGMVLPDETLSWTAVYDATNSLPSQLTTAAGSQSTGAFYDDFGRITDIWAIPGRPETLTIWNYDAMGRVIGQSGDRFLLDPQGLRFRRTKTNGVVRYVIYGFNREPLSTFETGPTAPASPAPSQAKVVGRKP